MTEAAPTPSSIKARISALNLEQVGAVPGTPPPYTFDSVVTAKKARPPPPPPPGKRPAPPERRPKSTNNPPVQSHGYANETEPGNMPAQLSVKATAPQPPARPSLPPRSSQNGSKPPPPSLPPRRPSEQSVISRKASVDSISSAASARTTGSAISLRASTNGQNGTTRDEMYRVKAPTFDPSKLPPLPPKREKTEDILRNGRAPLRQSTYTSNRSAPKATSPAPVQTVKAPSLPNRPAGKSPIPSRPVTITEKEVENGPPTLPSRPALPSRPVSVQKEAPKPTASKRSALSFGMNKSLETAPSLPTTRPGPTDGYSTTPIPAPTIPAGPDVVELTPKNFDQVVFAGKPTLVNFGTPWCKYCIELDPAYQELGRSYKGSDVTIAKVQANDHKELAARYGIEGWPTLKYFDGRSDTPEDCWVERNTEALTKFVKKKSGVKPGSISAAANGAPPPVPTGSRPDLSAIMSSKPKAGAKAECLICRDFSAVDAHAARFPRGAIPSTDIAWLSHQLTSPFPSATDKARVIFTWLHHNIAYDVDAFFGNAVRGCTPADTISKGAGVCSGYADLFNILAIHAGLESVVISGGSKGFGFKELAPGAPIPPYKSDHAWNAVKIDNGEWKLIDSCWGAGNVGDDQRYTKSFKPHEFTMSNVDFGRKHFPGDNNQQYREDRRVISWAEFLTPEPGGRLTVYSSATSVHGFGERTFFPDQKKISVRTPPGESDVIRFQFTYQCPHWDPMRSHQGKPFLWVMILNGLDGRNKEVLAFNSDGRQYWLDLRRQDLGAPGQSLTVFGLTELGGKPARGMTAEEFKRKYVPGRVGWKMGEGLCSWDLV